MDNLVRKYRYSAMLGALLGSLVAILIFTDWAPNEQKQLLHSLTAASINSEVVKNKEVIIELPTYIEIINSCGPRYLSECVVARSSPTTTAPVLAQLRSGIVLKVATSTFQEESGRVWYQVIFDEWVRYPNRIQGKWYIASDYVRVFKNTGPTDILPNDTFASSTKRIVIDRGDQMIYAYEENSLFAKTPISTGLELTPTPRGVFHIYRKTPTRYMQGPLPGISNQYYDLPGVPWNLYFTYQGGAIHGTYWHDSFGKKWSHGCVNLPSDMAEKIYKWADLGTEVRVQD